MQSKHNKNGEQVSRSEVFLESPSMVQNPQIAPYMPRNSILVYIGNNDAGGKPYIAFPFFPPHFSLPLKPGEKVWLLSEKTDPKSDQISFYYWMCRTVGDRQIDDLNLTNTNRSTALRSLNREFKGSKITDEDLIIPTVMADKSHETSYPPNVTTSNIQANSFAYKSEFCAEPVPRMTSKCSDMTLQGSNNSTLQMTTEKFRPKTDIASTAFLGTEASANKYNTHTPLAGAVDLFVGKEKTRLRELSEEKNPEDKSAGGQFNAIVSKRRPGNQKMEHYEASKIDQYIQDSNENILEGNDDPRNVYARLYLGMNSAPDKSFEFINSDFSSETGDEEKRQINTGASAILYGDHVRCFAENSVRFHVYPPSDVDKSKGIAELPGGSLIDMSNDGTITLQSGEGDKAAKIILRPTGDIVIRPGSDGLLYLGGTEEDISIVAVGASMKATPLGGNTIDGLLVPGVPVADTFGGQSFLGAAYPPSGNVSSKVVIKV